MPSAFKVCNSRICLVYSACRLSIYLTASLYASRFFTASFVAFIKLSSSVSRASLSAATMMVSNSAALSFAVCMSVLTASLSAFSGSSSSIGSNGSGRLSTASVEYASAAFLAVASARSFASLTFFFSVSIEDSISAFFSSSLSSSAAVSTSVLRPSYSVIALSMASTSSPLPS